MAIHHNPFNTIVVVPAPRLAKRGCSVQHVAKDSLQQMRKVEQKRNSWVLWGEEQAETQSAI